MSRFNKLLSNFSHGEISPKFYGRKDLEEYSKSGQLFDNFIPQIQGGFSNRGATKFIADVTDLGVSTRGPALLPFIVSKTEAFVIVINPAGVLGSVTPYIRIFKNDGVESTPISPFFDIEAPPNDLDPKGFVSAQVGDVLFLTHTSGRFRPLVIVKRSPSADNFSITDLTSTIVIEDQNLTQVNTILKHPFRDTNISPITIAPSATSGNITLASSIDFFNVGQINALIKITHGNTTGVARITGVTSTTSATATVLVNFGATSAVDNWEESSWSIYRGYPRTVAAFEQRIVWGGNISEPDTLWFSRLANAFMMMQKRLIQDFSGDSSGVGYFIPSGIPAEQQKFGGTGIQLLEDDPFSFALASVEANPISWMSSGRNLLVGTLGSEYVVGSGGEGLSILSSISRQQTNYGGAPRKVVRTGNELLYFTRDGQKLRTFKYNDENGSYVSADISIMAEHLRRVGDDLYSGFSQTLEWLDIVHQASKDTLWLINSQNTLIGLVYSRENGNISWFRNTFENANIPPAGGTSINIWGVTSIPNVFGGNDDVWIITERTAGGIRNFYLEKIGAKFEGDSLIQTPLIDENLPTFVDSYVTINNLAGGPMPVISGLIHLEDLEVRVMYRGENLGTYTVDGAGEITLDAAAQVKIQVAGIGVVGIPYTSTFESLDIEAGGDLGFSEGQTQRIDLANVRFNKTRTAKVGSIIRQQEVDFRHAITTDLFTGIKEIRIPNSPNKDQRIKIVNSESQPCNIMSIALKGNTDDN